jgi:hypothetical protein
VRGPDRITCSTPRIVDSEASLGLQFVNTTSTTTIDDSAKRIIRGNASHYGRRARAPSRRACPKSPSMKRTDGSTTGQVHRFRLGPEGLKLTSNKRANKRGKRSLNFTSPSIGSDKQPSAVRASPALQRLAGTSRLAVTRPRQRIIARENEENKLFPESSFRTAIGPPPDDSSQENVAELVRWTKEQQLTWLKTLLYPRGSSLYGLSSCAMDPFDAMSLNITPREQILIRDYCEYKSKYGV